MLYLHMRKPQRKPIMRVFFIQTLTPSGVTGENFQSVSVAQSKWANAKRMSRA